MDEKRIARNLDKIFSDTRLNAVELAHLTARTMNDHANSIVTQWYSWHYDLLIQQEYPGQTLLDLDFYME